MILATLLLMQAAYPPETEAVMGRDHGRPPQRGAQPEPASAATRAAKALATHLPPKVALKLQTCLDNAVDDPQAGLKFAEDWAKDGGAFSADQCRGFAYGRADRWDEAAAAFDAGALAARKSGSVPDAARLWAQAGNAALAGGKADAAKRHFDAALSGGLPDGLATGEVHLDRARALVALNDMPGARADLDAAIRLAADDPLAWLLSATLARRMDDLARAQSDIGEAAKRAPNDPHVVAEQGNIAMASGDQAAAVAAWRSVIAIAPDSDPASAARAYLGRLDAQAAMP